LLDQNILITAYEKPLIVSEIARALGTPMAFIEESVNNLVDAQLMIIYNRLANGTPRLDRRIGLNINTI